MPLVCATPLPVPPGLPEGAAGPWLAQLCARWERRAGPRLSPAQRGHCRRFAPRGQALSARASRLLARLLALRELPGSAGLDMDAAGRPLVTGSSGWEVAFSHSGCAAFCLVCSPEETAAPPDGTTGAALDAEPLAGVPLPDRAFPGEAASPRASLLRWVLAEALFKAHGARPGMWGEIAGAAHLAAAARAPLCAGSFRLRGRALSWRLLALPGHRLCVALPGAAGAPLRLRWLPWQSLA